MKPIEPDAELDASPGVTSTSSTASGPTPAVRAGPRRLLRHRRRTLVQRVDLHRPRHHFHALRYGQRGCRRDRRAEGTAARRRPQRGGQPAARDWFGRARRGVAGRQTIARGERIMGFGHREIPCLRPSGSRPARRGQPEWPAWLTGWSSAVAVEDVVLRVLAESSLTARSRRTSSSMRRPSCRAWARRPCSPPRSRWPVMPLDSAPPRTGRRPTGSSARRPLCRRAGAVVLAGLSDPHLQESPLGGIVGQRQGPTRLPAPRPAVHARRARLVPHEEVIAVQARRERLDVHERRLGPSPRPPPALDPGRPPGPARAEQARRRGGGCRPAGGRPGGDVACTPRMAACSGRSRVGPCSDRPTAPPRHRSRPGPTENGSGRAAGRVTIGREAGIGAGQVKAHEGEQANTSGSSGISRASSEVSHSASRARSRRSLASPDEAR